MVSPETELLDCGTDKLIHSNQHGPFTVEQEPDQVTAKSTGRTITHVHSPGRTITHVHSPATMQKLPRQS